MRPIQFFLLAFAGAMLLVNYDVSAQTTAKPATVIQMGSLVAFDYTLTDESGNVIDTSKGKKPIWRACPWAARKK